MKKLLTAGLLAGVLGATGHAIADQSLATSSGCLACHQVETKVVGPALKDIAAKYKGQDGARDSLVQSVIDGGANTWGPIPMPPRGGRASLSDEDIGKIVDWILTL